LLDKRAGIEGPVVGIQKLTGTARIKGKIGTHSSAAHDGYETAEIRDQIELRGPATDLAKIWQEHRYGLQALKPAFEPICAGIEAGI